MDGSRKTEVEAKSGLSRAPFAEPFLVSLYRVLAPYRGCGHACSYCDGRAEKYYVEGDFERDIAVHANIVERLRVDLERGKAEAEYGAVCFGSGVTDVYQPIEAELGLTRSLLEALQTSGLPVVVLTKSSLVKRDFDLLSRFPQVLVILTVTTLDKKTAAWLEPGASTPEDRLATVRAAREAGFLSGVMAMPFCPGLSDSPQQIHELASAAKEAGAQFVYPGLLTLRPGRQKNLYMERLSAQRPDLIPLYDRLYAGNRPSGMPISSVSTKGQRIASECVSGLGLAPLIPWAVYRNLLSASDSLFVFLCHLESLYASRSVNVGPLKMATVRYVDRLNTERTELRRAWARERRLERRDGAKMASDNLLFDYAHERCEYQQLEPAFPVSRRLDEFVDKELEQILGNDKLGNLCRDLLIGRDDFDYATLRPIHRES